MPVPKNGMKLTALVVVLAVLSMALVGCGGAATPAPTPTTVAAAPTAATEATVAPSEPAAEVGAASLLGAYAGAIDIVGQKLAIDVRIQEGEDGLSGELDIPAQGAFGIPLDKLTFEGSTVSFTILSGPSLGVFAGEVDADGNVAGSFVQAGYTGTFTLQPAVAEELPYREEEVTFSHGDITLAGTLSLPDGEGPFPAVVMISGTGAQSRDENVMGFRVFFEMSDYLTRHGIAVLRYDDRGVGGSTGDLTVATQDDLAEDVSAAVDLLLTRDDIDHDAIGLVGHSEGGLVAPITANLNQGVSYLVLVSGPATTGEQVLMDQLELIMAAQGASAEEIEAAKVTQQQTLAAVKTGEGWEEIIARSEAELRAIVEALPEEQRKTIGDVDKFVEDNIAAQIAGVNNPWFRSFVEYDPVPALQALKVPVLGLFGSLDLQVPAEKNAAAMGEALEQAGVSHRVEIIPEANHLFQKAITGAVEEYGVLEPAFVPGMLDLIRDWILEQVG